ncbi:consortin isoform X1 [Carcharodon carcharias]|uniref:consortin isoform X1 n=1 Tax=Carcharodon carcharias TaxID=13397 RepID=UPI001B7E96F6|nr:consortin isoform X1 [Carcharodon carcharias]XP_041031597.1 consortin isoform X1 [Carcharodon carcharias]
MDEGGSLATELGTTEKNSCNESVEKPNAISHPSPLISDENENRICEAQISPCSNDRMGGFEWSKQDLINNNEDNHDKTGFEITQNKCMKANCDDESEVSNSITNPSAELQLGVKTVSNWDSEMERKMETASSGTSEEATEDSSEFLSKSLNTVVYDRSSVSKVSSQHVDRKGRLQILLNYIQRETELNDSSSLPHYLHQIAEIYFEEEEYEKAIQFIQLEKLYHQKLLANLVAIQEHWEVKQKAANTRETSEGRPVKTLDDDKIVKLTEFCTSHCRPNVPVNEISVLAECFYKNEYHLPSKGGGACTDITAEYNSSFTDQPLATTRLQSAKCDDASLEVTEERKKDPTESVQIALTVDKSFKGESAMYDAESSLEGRVKAARAKGMMHFDVEREHLYSENTVTDEICFQPHATTPCQGMLTAAKTIETEDFSNEIEVVIKTTSLFHAEETENLHHDLKFAGKTEENMQTHLLECNKTIQFITDGQAASKQSNRAFQKHVKSDSNDCVNKEAMSRQNTDHSEASMRIDDQATEQNQTGLLNEINGCEQMSEKVGSKVEEEVQSSEKFNENQMSNEISETQEEEDENVEALCSSIRDAVSSRQKNDADEFSMQFNDSSLSLDELAKRIQIEENTQIEGLVSILKKGSPNKVVSRVQQKQSKRRVRFQEPQDTLEQDEVNGNSCLLLVLLCIVTVLLSVGGTALYCAFGDLESSVCRDFTTQMNFYYAQFQQGIEKAKHWLLFS